MSLQIKSANQRKALVQMMMNGELDENAASSARTAIQSWDYYNAEADKAIARPKQEALTQQAELPPDLRAKEREDVRKRIAAAETQLGQAREDLANEERYGAGVSAQAGQGAATRVRDLEAQIKRYTGELEGLGMERAEDGTTFRPTSYQPDLPGAAGVAQRVGALTSLGGIVGDVAGNVGAELGNAAIAGLSEDHEYTPGQATSMLRATKEGTPVGRAATLAGSAVPLIPGEKLVPMIRAPGVRNVVAGAIEGVGEGLLQDQLASVERGEGLTAPSAKGALLRAGAGALGAGAVTGLSRGAQALGKLDPETAAARKLLLESGGRQKPLGGFERSRPAQRAYDESLDRGTRVEDELAEPAAEKMLGEALRQQEERIARHQAEDAEFYAGSRGDQYPTDDPVVGLFDELISRYQPKEPGAERVLKGGKALADIKDMRERYLRRYAELEVGPKGRTDGKAVSVADLKLLGFSDEELAKMVRFVEEAPGPSTPAPPTPPGSSAATAPGARGGGTVGFGGAPTARGERAESRRPLPQWEIPGSVMPTAKARSLSPTIREPVEPVSDVELLSSGPRTAPDAPPTDLASGARTDPATGPRTDRDYPPTAELEALLSERTARGGHLGTERMPDAGGESQIGTVRGGPRTPRTPEEYASSLRDEDWGPEGTMRSMTESRREPKGREEPSVDLPSPRRAEAPPFEPTIKPPPSAPKGEPPSSGVDYEARLRGKPLNPQQIDELIQEVDLELKAGRKRTGREDPALIQLQRQLRELRETIPEDWAGVKRRQGEEIAADEGRNKVVGLPEAIPGGKVGRGGVREGRSNISPEAFQTFLRNVASVGSGGKPLTDRALMQLADEAGVTRALKAIRTEGAFKRLEKQASLDGQVRAVGTSGGVTPYVNSSLIGALKLRLQPLLEGLQKTEPRLSGRGGRLSAEIVSPDEREDDRFNLIARVWSLMGGGEGKDPKGFSPEQLSAIADVAGRYRDEQNKASGRSGKDIINQLARELLIGVTDPIDWVVRKDLTQEGGLDESRPRLGNQLLAKLDSALSGTDYEEILSRFEREDRDFPDVASLAAVFNPEQFAARTKSALKAVRIGIEGGANRDVRKAIRRGFRTLVEDRLGVASKDLGYGRPKGEAVEVYAPGTPRWKENMAAFHDWDGATGYAPEYMDHMRAASERLEKGIYDADVDDLPKRQVQNDTKALNTGIHEEIHAGSRCGAEAYAGIGKVLEEVGVELNARYVTQGLTPGTSESRVVHDTLHDPNAPYGAFIMRIEKDIRRVIGGTPKENKAMLREAYQKAVLGPGPELRSPEALEQALLDALPVTPEQATKIRDNWTVTVYELDIR